MFRKQLYLTDRQNEKIEKFSDSSGLSFAEIVRRILDYCIENNLLSKIVLYKPSKKRKSS